MPPEDTAPTAQQAPAAVNPPGGPAPHAPGPGAPAAGAGEGATAPAGPPKSPSDQFREHMAAKQKDIRGAKPLARRAPATGAGSPPVAAPETPPAAARAGEPTPPAAPEPGEASEEPKPPKEQAAAQVQLSRALRTLETREAELTTLRKENSTFKREATEYQALRQQARTPEGALDAIEEITGMDLQTLIRGVYEGKIPKGKGRPPPMDPALAERIATLEADRKAAQEQADRLAAREAYQADMQTTTAWLEANSERFPYLAAADWSAGTIVSRARANPEANPNEIVAELEEELRAKVEGLLGNERLLDRLLASHDKLKSKLGKAEPPAVSNGRGDTRGRASSTSLASLSSESGLVDTGERTRADIDRHAHEEFARHMAAKRKR